MGPQRRGRRARRRQERVRASAAFDEEDNNGSTSRKARSSSSSRAPRGQQRREFHQPHAAQRTRIAVPATTSTTATATASARSGVVFSFPARVYCDFAVYKSKTACKFAVIRPTFETKPDGSRSKRRDGGMLLEFAPAVGQRRYDWSRKQTILLSPLELVELPETLHLGRGVSFFHDPGMGTGRQGETTKSLKAEPMPDGSGGIFLNMATTAPGGKADERASRCPSPSLPLSGTSPRFSCRGSWGSRRCSSIRS